MKCMEVEFNSVKDIIRAAFPEAVSRRLVSVDTQEFYQVSDYWSEGSRTYTAFVELATLHSVPATALPQEVIQKEANPFGLAIARVQVSVNYAIVEHVIFRGKNLGYRLILHPDNLPKMLPEKRAELAEKDARISVSFRSLKSGPYRQEALSSVGYTIADRDRLERLGYLKVSANGATQITNSGRMVVSDKM